RLKTAGDSIKEAQVQKVGEEENKSFEVVSRETSKEIVVGAIMETLQNDINVQPALTFKLARDPNTGAGYFPIKSEKLAELSLPITPMEAAGLDLQGWRGGVAIVLEDVQPPQKIQVVKDRVKAMR